MKISFDLDNTLIPNNRLKINCSKYPKAFDFDLHIDDSKGVEIESEKHNFNVIIVSSVDKEWYNTIKLNLKKYI